MTRAIALAGILLLATAAASAADAPVEKGDLWESTSEMSMQGMTMPAHTAQVCADRGWSKPPVGGDDHGCTMYDVVNTPTKTSWKIKCDSESMTGEGEITRTSPDSYQGSMRFHAKQGDMTMKLSGKKIGECDVAAAKQKQAATIAHAEAQAAAANQQMTDAKTQTCQTAIQTSNLMYMTMPGSFCTDPAQKTAFCDRIQTREGFTAVAQNTMGAPYGKADIASYCAVKLDDIHAKLCTEAMNPRDLKFLGPNCPEQTTAIAKAECAGREGTTFYQTEIGQFCGTYAKDVMTAAKSDKGQDQKPESAGKKAKKALKGLWP
ncbi:MAG TPA: DUF3617 family protein [Candidatus Polarisedimenticolaceae bacterium]|nr:DUF3617 family protein [Candidatus Polarisedimenticolaceae bacterium]